MDLLSLPPLVIVEVLRRLDGRSLLALEQTNSYFSRKEPGSRLSLVEHVARESVLQLCGGSLADAERFRHRSWRERLHLEEATGVGFDRTFSEGGGFSFHFGKGGDAMRSVRLTGMGPKLLVSDLSTREQSVLRWRLRVKGNTAVEFGVVPADLQPSHTALHKCMSAPGCPQQRPMGFCSQITAGSLLPLKAPVMRGTILDVLARRGHLEVVLVYPDDAKEISWQNGQPVQRPYRGPNQLRFEQDFPADYDVRLAVTSWAKAHFEVLHTGYHVDPDWAAESAAADQAADAAEAAADAAPQGLPLPEHFLAAVEPEGIEAEQVPLHLPLHQPADYVQLPAAVQPEMLLEHALEAPPDAPIAAAQQPHHMLAGAMQSIAQAAPVVAGAVAADAAFAAAQQLNGGMHLEPATLADALAAAGEPCDDPHDLNALAVAQHVQPAALLANLAAVLQLDIAGADLAAAPSQQLLAAPPIGHATAGAVHPALLLHPLLCPSHSGELSDDGHLPAPSQG